MPHYSRRQQRHHDDRNGQHHHNKNHSSNAHLMGTTVSVVQKHDQPTGRLTTGVVAEILTNSAFHPRGIKVRLQDGTVGRIQQASGGGTNETAGGADYFVNDDEDDYHAPRGSTSLADFMPVQQQQEQQRPIVPPLSNFGSIEEEGTSSSWACPACTFLNSNLLTECELCQTPKALETS